MDYDISPPLIFKFQISSSRLCLSEEISYATGSRSRIYIYIYARFCATSMQPVKLCKSVYVKLCHTSVDWGKENIYFMENICFLHSYGALNTDLYLCIVQQQHHCQKYNGLKNHPDNQTIIFTVTSDLYHKTGT